jgi:hypothetical protein
VCGSCVIENLARDFDLKFEYFDLGTFSRNKSFTVLHMFTHNAYTWRYLFKLDKYLFKSLSDHQINGNMEDGLTSNESKDGFDPYDSSSLYALLQTGRWDTEITDRTVSSLCNPPPALVNGEDVLETFADFRSKDSVRRSLARFHSKIQTALDHIEQRLRVNSQFQYMSKEWQNSLDQGAQTSYNAIRHVTIGLAASRGAIDVIRAEILSVATKYLSKYSVLERKRLQNALALANRLEYRIKKNIGKTKTLDNNVNPEEVSLHPADNGSIETEIATLPKGNASIQPIVTDGDDGESMNGVPMDNSDDSHISDDLDDSDNALEKLSAEVEAVKQREMEALDKAARLRDQLERKVEEVREVREEMAQMKECMTPRPASTSLTIKNEVLNCVAEVDDDEHDDDVVSQLQDLLPIDGINKVGTAARCFALENALVKLFKDRCALLSELRGYRQAAQRAEAARLRKEMDQQVEKKNVIEEYLDLLGSQGEGAWKDYLIGMGNGADVPKVFRYSGKVRNKHLSKRDTEKLVKEIWKERLSDPAVAAGRATNFVDFFSSFLQKRVGIAAAVLELGYNLLYGLWLYQWDADCELFLKVLTGEVLEDVYLAQIRLQSDIEELFVALDKAQGTVHVTGTIPKDDVRCALEAFFRVGHPSAINGKTLVRFDEMMQALDTDQPGETVEWKKVFDEDREFNQGEFAETLRDQFLQERIDYFDALETKIYEYLSDNERECSKDVVIKAVLELHSHDEEDTLDKKVIANFVDEAFGNETTTLGIKAVMKKLSRGLLRRQGVWCVQGRTHRGSAAGCSGGGRTTGSFLSIASRSSAAGSASQQPQQQQPQLLNTPKLQNPGIARAMEAVRQRWLQKQIST